MRTLFIGFALLIALASSHAQPVWESENGPYGGTFIDIIAHGDSIVAAPYYRPFLLIGDTNGENWRQVDMPSPAAEPFSILSPGEGRLLVGSFGRIYRSDDNGATWNERYLPDMQGEIVDELTGEGDTLFACGNGFLYRSLDRGISWQLQEGAPEVFTVKVFKDQVVVGGPAGIHLSSDYGVNWEHAPFEADSVTALFTASKHLFAALRSPLLDDSLEQKRLYRSTDGRQWQGTGAWKSSVSPRTPVATIAEYKDTLYAGLRSTKEPQPLWRSTDDGASWNAFSSQAYNEIFPRDVWGLFSTSTSLLISCGGIGIWRIQPATSYSSYVSGGYYAVGIAKLGFDDKRMYAYSMKENFIVTRKFGSDQWKRMPYWTPGERPGDMYIDTASSSYDSTVVFLGLKGGVDLTHDQGSNWYGDRIWNFTGPVQALIRVGSKILGGVGNHGAMYSTDDGHSWDLHEGDGPTQWFGFASSGTDVWAATTDGLLRSTNIGESWNAFGPSGSCYAVAVWDENTVITASEGGVHALDTRSAVSTPLWTVSAGYALHALPDGGGICAATQDSGIVFFQYPGAAPVVLREGLPAVGFAPPTVCRIALDSHDGRLYFGNCGLPGLWSLDLSAIPVSVREIPPVPAGMVLSPAYPNPAGGASSVTLDLGSEEYVEITLVDRLGRTMRIVHQGSMRRGRHTVSVDVGDLPAGLYFCVARAGARVSTVPLSVLH